MTLEPTGSTGCAGRRGPSGAARDSGRPPSLPWRRCKSFIMSNLPATPPPPPEQISCQLGRSSVGKTDRVPAPLPVAAGAATESSAPLVVPGTAPAFRRHADRRPKHRRALAAVVPGRFGNKPRGRGAAVGAVGRRQHLEDLIRRTIDRIEQERSLHVHVDAEPIVEILSETLDKLRSSLEALESFDPEPEQIGTEQEQIGN